MKDQYFGDARDYFKYQLLEDLLKGVPGLTRLVCLWMLTPPDESGQGNVRFEGTVRNERLATSLSKHLETGDRRIYHMRRYFRSRRIEYIPRGDQPPYFSTETRSGYFSQISTEDLRSALVFFDPDIGMATGRPSPQHLAWEELKDVFIRMDAESVAVVYQHRWRTTDFWELMARKIETSLGSPVRFVAEPSVGFYVLPKRPEQLAAIDPLLKRVAADSPKRVTGPGEL